MNIPPLTVIEASAGSGKTFTLVTRLLKLIFAGTEPERIVALTFSRMAAGEIFNSFIERLSDAAGDEATAQAESKRIGKALSKADFAAMLRKVISRQHLSLIGTLDSFLMRIVRMLPFELGIEGEISVMSEYRSPVEQMRLIGELMTLQSDDAKEVFRSAFHLAFGKIGAQKFLDGFADFIGNWHRYYRANPDSSSWGDKHHIWQDEIPDGLEVTLSEIRAMADKLLAIGPKQGLDKFVEAVRIFSGTIPNVVKSISQEPLVIKTFEMMCAWKVADSLRMTQGIYQLMRAYDEAYAYKVRKRGNITFDDMPRLVNSIPDSIKLPLEYRMDAKFDHWALDEFQDTSIEQFKAIGNLTEEAMMPDSGKSVFIVGDKKQSIYSWRGGDTAILARMVKAAEKQGNAIVSLDESFRYVQTISDAVNRVFNENMVRSLIDMDDAREGLVWQCREHISHNRDEVGFVEVVQAVKKAKQAAISDFFEPITNALNAVKPWEKGIETAILVRKNAIGMAILGYLKENVTDKVVFEGDSEIADTPVISAMVELLRLAEHANDTFAYEHIRLSPLSLAMYPKGLPDANKLSAELLADFTRLGMVRKFREVREALKAIDDSWNDFTESRFADFIKCAAEFEDMRDSTMRLADFADFLAHRTRRDFAESGMIRIMTMHQSKGLGFDWVIIPFYEHDKLIDEEHADQLVHTNPDWLMVNPKAKVNIHFAPLAEANRVRCQQQIYDSLCLDYVAMTRAKKALTLILHPLNKTPAAEVERFSDLIRISNLTTSGDSQWWQKFATSKKDEEQSENIDESAVRPEFIRAQRVKVAKIRPSESYFAGLKGDILFDSSFGKAAKRGVELHNKYASMEWADDAALKTLPIKWREAFMRRSDEDTLWRECPYELFIDGKWESGQFDRVVFRRSDGICRAHIYDFKTNCRHRDETDSEFATRMRETYSKQLETYRMALAKLTSISTDKITASLLLTSTGDEIAIG